MLPGSWSGLALLFAFIAFAVVAVVPSAAQNPAGSQSSSQVTVTQCGDPGSGQASCDQSSVSLAPAPAKPQPRKPKMTVVVSQPAPARSSRSNPSAEVHRYSLVTGKGQVTTANGTRLADRLTIKATPKVPGLPKPTAPSNPTGSNLSRPIATPPVTTVGGSMLGVTSGVNLISSDQAVSQFAIPPFLVPIYVAAGRTYGVPWNVLAAINKIETDFGRNLSISSAGAEGWMQFMPAEWSVYGVDATGRGFADPYNPVDAIYAAARYLRAYGAATNVRAAIFAYNHATWYVDQVLQTASIYGSLPSGLVAETGSLAYGRFPVLGRARYGDDFIPGAPASLPGLLIQAPGGAPAVATQQVTVEKILLDPPLARTLRSQGRLALLGTAPVAPAPSSAPAPVQPSGDWLTSVTATVSQLAGAATGTTVSGSGTALGASAGRAAAAARAANGLPAGYAVNRMPGIGVIVKDAVGDQYRYTGLAEVDGAVRPGAKLSGGQTIGTLPPGRQATLGFSAIAAAGSAIDPRPLVDGYRLQEAAGFYHAMDPLGANPFVPSTASSSIGHGYVFPVPANVPWTSARTDMGWDIETGDAGVGHPLLAIGDAQILHIQDMGGFGPTWISYKLLDGPAAGRTVFIGHSGPPLVQPGQLVRAGQPIILIHGGTYGGPPGHLEIGWASSDGINTLAAPHYHEGDVTPEGVSFKSFLLGVSGSSGGLVFPDILGGVNPSRATKAQEFTLSAELDKITNPRVANRPGPGSVATPLPGAQPAPRATGLVTQPAAAGARIVDVSVPDGARGGEAYAIGTVAGLGHPGWAATQTVLLGYSDNAWRVLGAPVDGHGHVVNPQLAAIGAVRGGSGYAVGAGGEVVTFNSYSPPAVLASPTKQPLSAIAARRQAGRLVGVAVGAGGAVVRLSASHATANPPVAGRPPLTAVAYEPDGTALVTGPADLYRVQGAQAQPQHIALGLPAQSTVDLTSLSTRAGQLWVAGGVSDAPGQPADLPFAARLTGHGWQTYCASAPALSQIFELGAQTKSSCAHQLNVPTGGTGPVTAITATAHSAVAAAPGGLAVVAGSGSAAQQLALPARVNALALDPNDRGWAVAGDGSLAWVGRSGDRAAIAPGAVVNLPVKGSSAPAPATVAATPGGAGALALAGGQASSLAQGSWRAAAGPGVAVRDAAASSPQQAFAVAQTGQLLAYAGGKWSVVDGGAGDGKLAALAGLAQYLGNQPLTAGLGQYSTSGFNALTQLASGEGYAVGGQGLIAHFSGGRWQRESAPTTATLTSVAAAPGQIVAVGTGGTLLEKGSGDWHADADAATLAGGQAFSAVAADGGGTVVAAAGPTLLEQRSPGDPWTVAELAPFGAPPLKLSIYRDAATQLHALALVPGIGGLALLDGDSSGWRSVMLPAGFQLSDFDLSAQTQQLLLAGTQSGQPATAQADLASATTVPAGTSTPVLDLKWLF